jgi:hypothetical protein
MSEATAEIVRRMFELSRRRRQSVAGGTESGS